MNKRTLLFLCIVLGLLFTNMWFAYRYTRIKRELVEVAHRQDELLAENKRIVTALSILRSPQTIIPYAHERYALGVLDYSRIIQVHEQSSRQEAPGP